MADCLYKLIEKIVKNHGTFDDDLVREFGLNQFGFANGVSVGDAIERMWHLQRQNVLGNNGS